MKEFMLTTNENLFHVIARDLVASRLNEIYLLAGQEFELLHPSVDVRRAVGVAKSLVNAELATDALALHYNLATKIQESGVVFKDDCSGIVQSGGAVVQFSVRKVSEEPTRYRVLFTRLDSGQLATNMVDRMNALEERISKIEHLPPKT